MAYTDGIDVSHYQGDVDWGQVAQAGMRFAIAKAAEGNSTGDSEFSKNWDGIKAAGMLRAAYDYYIVGDKPQTQAQNLISKLALVSGDLPPVVDIETESAGAEGDTQLIADLHSYLETLSGHYGVAPIIYSGPSFWNAHFDSSFGTYPLWVAEYGVSAPKPMNGWSTWTMWQHSQDGSVAGISGPVDLNYFNGSDGQLQALTKK